MSWQVTADFILQTFIKIYCSAGAPMNLSADIWYKVVFLNVFHWRSVKSVGLFFSLYLCPDRGFDFRWGHWELSLT